MKKIYIAGLDIDFTKAVTKANRGEPDSWRVIEKVSDNIVKVIFK